MNEILTWFDYNSSFRNLWIKLSDLRFRNTGAGLLSGRSRVQTRPDQHLGSLNNWEESAAFVMTSVNG